MLKKWKNLSMSAKIFIGMLLGILAGFFLGDFMSNFKFIGTIWMNMLKISIAPIVLVMLILGIGRQKDLKRLAGLSIGLIAYYILTTIMASMLAIGVTSVTRAGEGFHITGDASTLETTTYTLPKFLLSLVPDNFFVPLNNNTVLQILFLGIIGGIVVLTMKDAERKEKILDLCDTIQAFFNGFLHMGLAFAPVGIFCFMGDIIGSNGGEVLASMGRFLAAMLTADALQLLFYGFIVIFLLARKSPIGYFRNMLPTWAISLTTASSVLCIPTNIEICNNKYDVDPAFTNFGIPLGAQLNTDGSAIFLPCALVFAAQALGIHYDFGTLMYMGLVSALIASTGGGVFGGALVKLLMMCQLFAVPDTIISMIAGLFAVIDLFITTVNVSGDVAGVVLIDSIDKRLRAKKQVHNG